MKKKINSKFMLISAIAIIVMAICAMVLFYDILKKQIFDDLKANAHVISMMNPEDLPDEINYNLNKDGLRITLINEDGTVIYDSMEDESKMENHRERPEIASALAAGEGRAMRKSTTSAKHTFYYAMRTDDGKVLRIGKDSNSIYSLIIKMVYLTLSVGFCVFVLCTVLAHRLTRRLVAPIEKMADNIVLLEENDVYDEMKPFVATIKQQHVDILKHSQMRQEFTANVSHELKTPLTSMKVLSDSLLSQEGMPEELYREFLGDITSEIERMTNIINDLLSMAKLEKNSADMTIVNISINELLDGVLKRLRPIAAKRNIELVYESYRPVVADVDEVKMSIALNNLIENAIKYNYDGGWVHVTLNADHKFFYVRIQDSGVGIPEELQDKIFERFYRVDKARSRETGGTGLGLALTRRAILLHRGSIKVYSKEKEGTTFTIRIPLNYVTAEN